MRRLTAIILLGAVAGCAPHSATNDLRAGMSREQVFALMGTPDSGATVSSSADGPARDCSYYDLYRNMWTRPAGFSPDRYYACFENDSLSSFGLQRLPRAGGGGAF